MAKDSIIHTRVDSKTKKAAEAIFSKLGISMSEAMNMFLHRSIMEEGIPFEVKIPNKTTRHAIEEIRKGGGKTYKNIEEMMADVFK